MWQLSLSRVRLLNLTPSHAELLSIIIRWVLGPHNYQFISWYNPNDYIMLDTISNRPGVAGDVLQTPL